jgi:hypothetical protein
MSNKEEKIDIAEKVMKEIREDRVKMRPRAYFIVGSILSFLGLVGVTVSSVFLVGLTRFALRAHGPMWSFRLDRIISEFPWWIPVLAVIGLVAGIWMLRKYDFSYKKNVWMIILGFILAVFLAGWFVDFLGLNDVWVRRGPIRGFMRGQHWERMHMSPDPGLRWHRMR